MPVFDMIEYYLVITMKFKPSKALRFVARTIFVGKSLDSQLVYIYFDELIICLFLFWLVADYRLMFCWQPSHCSLV